MILEIIETEIEGLFILKPKIFKDNRGYFFESFNKKALDKLRFKYEFVQDNQSFSSYGTIRGLHFQTGNSSQAKLVRVIQGEVIDVVVDLRQNSKSFGKHFKVKLNDQNNYQLLIPRGFAHGFSVTSKTAIFSYKCDNYYNSSAESGIIFNDTTLNIDWEIPSSEQKLSEKDLKLGKFDDYCNRL